MTAHTLCIVIEKIDSKTNKVVSKNIASSFDITPPKNILDLGLRNQDQIAVLQNVQDYLLSEQEFFFKSEYECCPKCNSKLSGNGYKISEFHALFSDHKIKVQKQKCSSKYCDCNSINTVKSLFGTSVHTHIGHVSKIAV